MGANEKHAATYHGREYTPTTAIVHSIYMTAWNSTVDPVDQQEVKNKARDEFTRWLETVRAEAKAEAYKDAADALHAEARWQTDLLLRHEEYRFRHCANRMTEMENVMLARASQYKEDADNGR